MLRRLLQLPETAGLDLDDPATTNLRRDIIRRKGFLRRLYREWYAFLADEAAQAPAGPVLEAGSGAGFLSDVLPGVITSEVALMGRPRVVLSAEVLPFPEKSLAAVVMADVLHHVPCPANFFAEARRCLKPGGRIAMVEPACTPWARAVWGRLHHEPLDVTAGWELPPGGPLSAANIALPWILFERDRAKFAQTFPEFRVVRREPFMPFAYLASGGVSMRSLAPGVAYPLVRAGERALGPLTRWLGLFQRIVLVRE